MSIAQQQSEQKIREEVRQLRLNSLMHGQALDKLAAKHGMTPRQGLDALNVIRFPKNALSGQKLTAFHLEWLQDLTAVHEQRATKIRKDFEEEMKSRGN